MTIDQTPMSFGVSNTPSSYERMKSCEPDFFNFEQMCKNKLLGHLKASPGGLGEIGAGNQEPFNLLISWINGHVGFDVRHSESSATPPILVRQR